MELILILLCILAVVTLLGHGIWELLAFLFTLSLDDARRLVAHYVLHYNTVRLHSAIGYVAPADKLHGRAPAVPCLLPFSASCLLPGLHLSYLNTTCHFCGTQDAHGPWPAPGANRRPRQNSVTF